MSGAIGVFDSGLGGLTVLRALRQRLPNARLVYLGDTARVPYGTRSAATVIRYAINNARTLVERHPLSALVIACNTVSAVALDELSSRYPIPVVGVVEPGARAAVAASGGKGIVVLGTAGTVRSGAYRRAIESIGFDGPIVEKACPLFVPLVEEGWLHGTVPTETAKHYLDAIAEPYDTVVLGCTHYPLLRDTLSKLLPGVAIVDGAQATADDVASLSLTDHHVDDGERALQRIYLTDAAGGVHSLATRFLGEPVAEGDVETIDLSLLSHIGEA